MTLKELEVMKRKEINSLRMQDMQQNYEREREKQLQLKEKVMVKHSKIE